MTEKYRLLVYYVHSYLESVRGELKITKDTTVENFREDPDNESHCKRVFTYALKQFDYELSNSQVSNGINLLLIAWYNTQSKGE
jgi:hypothetical protein